MTRVGYMIVCIYIIITFRVILMGIDKMTKLIIGNYITGITCFAFGNLINQCVNRFMNSPDSKFIGISYYKYADFLSDSQLLLILILFAGITRLIYSCGKFQVSYNTSSSTEKLFFIILIPITVLSFIIGPYIALQSDGIQVLNFIENTLSGTFGFLSDFIKHLPFRMFINGITFILLSSHINLKISLSSKATKLPEGL